MGADAREGNGLCLRPSQQPPDPQHMGTAFNPAKTSLASWDAFSDVDAFVDAVMAELTTMAGTKPTRRRPKPPLVGAALRKAIMAIWCVCFCGMQWRAIGQLSRSARCTRCLPPARPVAPAAQPLDPGLAAGLRRRCRSQYCYHRQPIMSLSA